MLNDKFTRAWESARDASRLLKENYGVTKVIVFGSLLHLEYFDQLSDVEIAASGIQTDDTFRAIYDVLGVSREIEVNLVDVEMCRPDILESIVETGIEI